MTTQEPHLRVVFMGTPSFAVPALQALIHSPHHVIGVVTQPDRPVGRGYQIRPSPVKLVALEYYIPLLQPQKLRDNSELHDSLRELAPDLMVVAAYGRILPRSVLDIPRCGCLNIHASLLPRYRGAAPISAAILNGDQQTGITLMLMNEGMDCGPILAQRTVSIGQATVVDDLGERLAHLGATLLLECVVPWVRGELPSRAQDDSQATYAPLVRKSDGLIDWQRSAVELERRWRAYYPWPGIYTFHRGRLLKVLRVAMESPRPDAQATPAGAIASVTERGLQVGCGSGCLLLQQVQPSGGRIMTAIEYARGARLIPGEKFTSEPANTGVSTQEHPS